MIHDNFSVSGMHIESLFEKLFLSGLWSSFNKASKQTRDGGACTKVHMLHRLVIEVVIK
jgi:hypothetical protein